MPASSGAASAQVGRQGDALRIAAAPLGQARASAVHDHRPHDPRCVAEERAPVVEGQLAGLDQAQVGLVHQRGRVQHGVAAAAAQARVGQAPQLLVGGREQRIPGCTVPVLHARQQHREGLAHAPTLVQP
jgi:hypothetical protein